MFHFPFILKINVFKFGRKTKVESFYLRRFSTTMFKCWKNNKFITLTDNHNISITSYSAWAYRHHRNLFKMQRRYLRNLSLKPKKCLLSPFFLFFFFLLHTYIYIKDALGNNSGDMKSHNACISTRMLCYDYIRKCNKKNKKIFWWP